MTNIPDYTDDAPPPYAGPHALSDEELSAIWRAKLMFRVLMVVVTIFAIALGSLTAVGVWVIRGTQVHNTKLTDETHTSAAETHETAELIKSCVTPGGDCFEQAQRRTGDVVGGLNQYVVLSASCTAHLVTTGAAENADQQQLTKLITACVIRQLATHTRKR